MIVQKQKEEFKKLNTEELVKKASELRREIFSLTLGITTGQVKDTSLFKKNKKNLARVLTFLQQKAAK
ncbi:MAG: 50S ribosomal protein L29 [candidate division TM6 bacterium GW2011_GWF2_32_72]|nr:MAG: 50S ribosomal protein L29 [candidate division TM6 bacterium GW2011_GWF2_32_72]